MKKKYIRSIISFVLCFTLAAALMMVSNVEASDRDEETKSALEYVMIDNPSVITPGTQKIVVGYNKGTVLTDATLRYKNMTSGEEYSVEASNIQDSTAVFEITYEDDSWAGIYSIEDITYIANGQKLFLNFAECGIEGKFAVNQVCETEPDAIVKGDRTEENTDVSNADVSFTAVAQDGTIYEDEDISGVINDAIEAQSGESEIATYTENRDAKFVVVLDPGHGGFDPGTSGHGANEKTLTLKIAKYCKNALERDAKIQVYMTRESDTGVGGAKDVSTDLKNRISFAVSKKANLFVSIHLNSASSSAYGAEVYYPNNNYRSDIGEKGKKLASSIQNQLVSLGLYNRGVKISNSSSSKYPDGSAQDYYYVIQQSKRNGFPGIIVEHAFLSNASDYQKYLSTDAKLKALGEADAKGIIEYINNNENLGNWKLEGSQWKYVYSNGSYAKDCWEKINGAWYHFDTNGFMQTGWLIVGNTRYYLNGSGAMVTGWLYLDGIWYYMNSSGAMVNACWTWIGNKCYYFDQNGKMASDTWVGDYYVNSSGAWVPGKKKPVDRWIYSSGRWWYCHADGSYTRANWEYIGNQWYYFDNAGWMVTGWLNLNGTWYYLNGSGAMVTGWLNLNGTWYYMNGSGAMLTGWLNYGTTVYYLSPSGSMRTGWLNLNGTWYYLNAGGARVSNCWTWIGNKCYYFDRDGKMASNTWIGDYYVDGSGAWVPGKKKEEIQAKDQWINSSGRWWYCHADGSYTKSNWEVIGNQTYYFDESGWMVTGYKQIAGTWYYFQQGAAPEGAMTYKGVTSIMGTSGLGSDMNTVVNKMVQMFQKSRRNYPSDKLGIGGADTIEKFCQIVYEEAIKEGVKPEIVFGQAMKETGYLQFGGSVKIEQFNFAGIGATDGGANGARFPDVATGIRAQVQHLKAYASNDNLTQERVDPRFGLVKRGCAPYVEWLGQSENPNGKLGWATAWNYGISLMNQYVKPMYSL